jgi:hypothetical protein
MWQRTSRQPEIQGRDECTETALMAIQLVGEVPRRCRVLASDVFLDWLGGKEFLPGPQRAEAERFLS